MSLLSEICEAIEDLQKLKQRLERFDAFQGEFRAELENMNLTEEQKTKLAKMIEG